MTPSEAAEKKYPMTTEQYRTNGFYVVSDLREAYLSGYNEGINEIERFAEWCEMNYWQVEKGIWVKSLDEPGAKRFTTKELYSIFKETNTNQP